MSGTQSAKEVFAEALEKAREDRAAFLASACAGDPALRAKVEELLAVYEDGGRFMSSPTVPEAATTESLAEGPGSRIGRYRLLQQIGEGGFGVVFMAEQEEPVRRRVALKVIKLGMDTRAVIARFEAERQALAVMDHPNIAKVLDGGATQTGRPYFVMELVSGEPITSYCDRNRLTISERLDLFVQACEAVQHAHMKGIIHRDIKPGNLLVETRDGRPHPKVLDFGIAKATDHRLTEKTLFTEHKALLGTPEYMSPEQAEAALDIDTRTDVYSLGVLLYEMLTGDTPLDGRRLRSAAYAEIQRIIREEEPPKPSTRVSESTATIAGVAAHRDTEPKKLGTIIRGELDWIVMKALEKDRRRRYETASAFALDIRCHLAGEPVAAAPPSAVYRMRKFVRRHRGQMAAAFLIATALLLGLMGTAWQAKVAADRARMALRAESEARSSRDAEKARADELKQVTTFQAAMLEGVDPTEAGKRLMTDINRKFAEGMERIHIPESQRPALVDAFAGHCKLVNGTDAARDLIDETILKPAVGAIETQFKDEPLVDAQLRHTLAGCYFSLGMNDEAYPLQKRALETRRRVLGNDHPDTLASINNMGGLLEAQGKLEEAGAYYREALEMRRRVLGEEHPDTLVSISNMGQLLRARGRLGEAEPYLREALEKRERVFGRDHLATLDSIESMGALLWAQGRFEQAEPYLREAVEKSQRVQGQDDPGTLVYISNLGNLLEAEGKFEEAEPCWREVLEKSRRVLGEEHPDTLISINNMGVLLRAQGKLEAAEPYFREALEKMRRVLGEEHPNTLAAITNLGGLLMALGRPAEAETYLREALEKKRRVLGEEHPDTLRSINSLGMLLRNLGRSVEAETEFGLGVAACTRAFPSPHPLTAMLLHHRADERLALHRLDEALADAERAVEMYRAHPDWSPNEASHAFSILANVLIAQGKIDDALAEQRKLIALQRATAPGSRELGDTLASVGLALLQRQTLEAASEAEPLLSECLEIRVKSIPDDWRVPNTRSMLGGAVLARAELDPGLMPAARAERLRQAETLLRDGYAGLKDNPAVPTSAQNGGADRQREALERVVRLYEAWNRTEPGRGYDAKAADWRAMLTGATVPVSPVRDR